MNDERIAPKPVRGKLCKERCYKKQKLVSKKIKLIPAFMR